MKTFKYALMNIVTGIVLFSCNFSGEQQEDALKNCRYNPSYALGKSYSSNSEATIISDDLLPNVTSEEKKQGEYVLRNSNGVIYERVHYVNGEKHGISRRYYHDGAVSWVSNYNYDSLEWIAPYIANQSRIIPIKRIKVYNDSIYVSVPHPNSELWYQGLFVNKQPVGIHKVYYDFGSIRGVIDYEELVLTTYDSLGIEGVTQNFIKY